jgi:hypothetical protein
MAIVCVCVNNQKSTPTPMSSSSSSSSLSFLGVYKRGLLRGKSRFVWSPATLGIIIRGFFQFHRSGPRLPLFRIAPHLRSLIRERVKVEVCLDDDNRWHNWADDRFELVCDRWVRLPSIRAVLLKLQECSRFVNLVVASSTDVSFQTLCDEGIMSEMFDVAMTREMSMMRNSHNHCCSSHRLPAVPRPPRPSEAVLGYCFTCGAGLSDKSDFNLVPKCDCVVGAGDMLLCSSCLD